MVLSNKKLKQKLRAELLAKKVAESEADKKKPDSNSEPQSLKSLLDSVTPKPRLSKREKRRKNIPFLIGSNQEAEGKGKECGEDEVQGNSEEVENKKKKKRKREEKVKNAKTTSENKESNNNSKKKKTKNKKKKKPKIVSEELGVLQVENATESQVREDVATKVYVGGIPYRYTEDDIQYYFESCGIITDVDCMKFPDTGKFRGIAIISFETEAAAKEALALDRAEMGGMQLTIQPYKSTRANKATGFAPKMVEGYNRIYVGNLSWDITEDDLKRFFSDCNISSIRFGTNKETGEFRGYAHVDFSDSVSVAMALKLDQEIVCGRPAKISCAVPKNAVKTQSRSDPTTNEVRKKDKGALSVEAPVSVEAPTVNEVDDGSSSVIDGKLRRRTCYECGQKGHISSACPKGSVSVEAPTVNEVGNCGSMVNEAPIVNEVDNGGSSITSGKLRRRTCYECGQKGHISAACPKGSASVKATASVEAPVSVEAPTVNEVGNGGSTVNEALTVNEVANDGLTVTSGKLRRRTCYECGQKGHISSACPSKKPAETTNTNTN
ncbi:protein gar2-like [Gossypium australe]|uniref:Protein gar2-like n=1 Tax=Gossypium australe TaxID=47621 RepID=A0A5B6WK51_9ROSI|nr:protein gar2-like [Gossypium australe]